MSAASIRAGGAYVEISTRNGMLEKGLAAAQASMRRLSAVAIATSRTMASGFGVVGGAMSTLHTATSALGKGFTSVGGTLTSLGGKLMNVKNLVLGLAASAGVGAMVKGFADSASAIDDMAKRTGLAAEEIQGLSFAASMSGTSIETVEAAIKKMQKAGVNTGRGTFEDFLTAADYIAKIEDPAKRASEAMKIFGKAGTQLLPMFEGGAAGIEELRSEANRLGLVMSDEAVVAGEELGDTMDKLWISLTAVSNRIGATLAPMVLELSEQLIELIGTVSTFIEQNKEWIVLTAKVAGVVAAVAAGVVALGAVISGIGAVMTGIGAAIGVVGSILGAILSPIGLIVVALGGAAAAFLYFSGTGSTILQYLSDRFQQLLEYVLPIFNAIGTALRSGQWAEAANIAMLMVEQMIRTGMQPLYNLWTDLYTWIGTAAIDAVTTVANVFAGIPTSIMNSFSTAITYLQGLFDGIGTTLQNSLSTVMTWLTGTWDRTVNGIAKSLLWLYSLFDKSINYEQAAKQMDKEAMQRGADRQKELDKVTQQRRADNQKRADERQRALDEVVNARNESLIAANQRRAEFADQIKTGMRDQAEERKSAFDARIKEIGTEIADSIERINAEAARQDAERATLQPKEDRQLPPLPETISDQVATKTQGTFSGFAAGLFGGGTSALDRLAKDTAAQTKILSEIAANTAEDDALELS